MRFRVCEGASKDLEIVLTKLETGVGSAGTAQLGQEEELPSWHISFAAEGLSDYSTVIAIGDYAFRDITMALILQHANSLSNEGRSGLEQGQAS